MNAVTERNEITIRLQEWLQTWRLSISDRPNKMPADVAPFGSVLRYVVYSEPPVACCVRRRQQHETTVTLISSHYCRLSEFISSGFSSPCAGGAAGASQKAGDHRTQLTQSGFSNSWQKPGAVATEQQKSSTSQLFRRVLRWPLKKRSCWMLLLLCADGDRN